VSDSHPFEVRETTDIAGVTHPVGLGVGHIYRLSPDGRRIHLNDWWLPADWSREVCPPDRGRVPLVGLSASASTLFVVDARGGLHTRLHDVDVGGENDLLTYAWDMQGPRGTTRALPAHPWVRQPDPPGPVTARVHIHQDGVGDAARVLRVEGTLEGAPVVFEKRIDAAAWRVRAHPGALSGPVLDPGAPVPAWVAPAPLEGRIWHDDGAGSLGITVEGHDAVCSPAAAVLDVDGVALTVDGAPLRLALHEVPGFVLEPRTAGWRRDGHTGPVRAALVGLDALDAVDDPVARALARRLLGPGIHVAFVGEAGLGRLDLSQIPRSHRFGVAFSEKVRDGHQLHLSARAGP
jgi:hypothetical protein